VDARGSLRVHGRPRRARGAQRVVRVRGLVVAGGGGVEGGQDAAPRLLQLLPVAQLPVWVAP
jgi:hypothetical protein